MKHDENILERKNIADLPMITVDWSIVVIALASEADRLAETLRQVEAQSLSKKIIILAADTGQLRKLCAQWSFPAQFVLPDDYPVNQYWRTVLQAINYQGARQVFVRAGCQMPTQWDARLIAVAEETGARAISPVSLQHPFLTIFNKPRQPTLSVDSLDQWLVDYIDGEAFDIAMILESVAVLQGWQWPAILACQSTKIDDDLFLAMREQGLLLLATDQLYVDDSKVHPLEKNSTMPLPWKVALEESHPLITARHALTEIDERGEEPLRLSDCLPVQLHVSHGWGGGLCRWVEDAVAGDDNHQNLVLRPLGDWSAFGKTMALYRSANMDVPIKKWLLAQPILSTAISHHQYQQVIDEIIQDFKVERLMISSLIAQSLDILRTGLPTTFVCHDFYPFCPAVVATFETPCTECSGIKQQNCQVNNDHHRFFTQESALHWEKVRSEFISLIMQDNVTLVAPTESVGARYSALVPEFQEKSFEVIPHGLDDVLLAALSEHIPSGKVTGDERLRIVILGSVVAQKGGEILTEIITELTQFADVWLLGSGKEGKAYKNISGVTVLPRYERMALGDELGEIQADLGLLLSTVPETFSYTLSELWAAGLPVVATQLGAFSDRVRENENGWLVQPEADAVMAKLQGLNLERGQVKKVQKKVCEQAHRNNKSMMKDYYHIEPESSGIARRRFHRARQQYNNPYQQGNTKQVSTALHIDHQVPFRLVLAEFIHYAGHKVAYSPRLSLWIRRPIIAFLKWRRKS